MRADVLTWLQSGGRGTEEQFLGDGWLLTEWMTSCRPRGCAEIGGWGAQVVRMLSGSGQDARDCGKCWRHFCCGEWRVLSPSKRHLLWESCLLRVCFWLLCTLTFSVSCLSASQSVYALQTNGRSRLLGTFLLRSCARDEGFWLMQSWWLFLSL